MAFKQWDQEAYDREEAEISREYDQRILALHTCEAANAELTEKERGLVQSCRTRVDTFRLLSDAQEKWLLDIARRVRDDLAGDIDALIHRWASGDHTGEHPTYRRADWPLAKGKDLDPTAYWVWVLREIRAHGGDEEHCSDCANRLNGEAWDGLCGNCADQAENESEHSHTA